MNSRSLNIDEQLNPTETRIVWKISYLTRFQMHVCLKKQTTTKTKSQRITFRLQIDKECEPCKNVKT